MSPLPAPQLGRKWRLALVTGLAVAVNLAQAQAQAQAPAALLSPAQVSERAMPVRVVCVADSPETFMRDEHFREQVLARQLERVDSPSGDAALRTLIAPLGLRYAVSLGSGFVVDTERRHVVSNWHVVTACVGGRATDRQLGILEAGAGELAPILADRLPDRTFQDASGRPVKLVQAVCRDKREACSADLPRSPDDKPLPEAVRRRQLDNLLAYAPDLAVLRLRSPARTSPLMLALNQQLDDQMRLVVRGHTPLPLRGGAPTSATVLYTGPQQISYQPLDGQPEDTIHAKLHRLAAPALPGFAGGPVLRADGVVGVLTVMLDGKPRAADGSSPAYAVPVTVVAVFLDLLKVPYVVAALELPSRRADAAPLAEAPAPGPSAWWAGPQALMMAGAAALALLAWAAFFTLARRSKPQAGPAPPPRPNSYPNSPPNSYPTSRPNLQPLRTVTRVNPTLLHAVAMPTAALDLAPTSAPDEALLAPAPKLPSPIAGVRLHCSAGPLAPQVFSLPMPNGGTTLFVGRDARSCQLVLPPDMDLVSAVHACFVWDPFARALAVRDLSSSGIWVRGQRIAKGQTVLLSAGDTVDLGGPGHNRFTIEIPGETASDSPSTDQEWLQ